MIGCINAVGNYVPPFFIFPRVNFKRNMLHGAPPGSDGDGAANPTGWSTSDLFIGTTFGIFHQAYKTISRRLSFANYR